MRHLERYVHVEQLTCILLIYFVLTHLLCSRAFPVVLQTSLVKHELKDKIIENFRAVTAEH